jgi:hypothetical protein
MTRFRLARHNLTIFERPGPIFRTRAHQSTETPFGVIYRIATDFSSLELSQFSPDSSALKPITAAARILYTVSGADELPPRLDTILAIVHLFTATTPSGRRRLDEQVAAIGASSAVRPVVLHLIYRSSFPLTAGSRGSAHRLSRSGGRSWPRSECELTDQDALRFGCSPPRTSEKLNPAALPGEFLAVLLRAPPAYRSAMARHSSQHWAAVQPGRNAALPWLMASSR